MRTYEIVFITAPNTTEDDLTKINSQLDKVVTDLGGTITKTDHWGRKKLAYKIGKFEVNNTEYCEFLNGVAKTNTLKLYDGRMDGEYGGITRKGESGSYTYTVKDGWGKKHGQRVLIAL